MELAWRDWGKQQKSSFSLNPLPDRDILKFSQHRGSLHAPPTLALKALRFTHGKVIWGVLLIVLKNNDYLVKNWRGLKVKKGLFTYTTSNC